VREARRLGIKVSVVPHLFDKQLHHLQFEELGGIPVMREKKYSPSFTYLFLKRTCDIIFASLLLIALLPLFLIVALLIRMDSPGPVIFRQQRVGLGGSKFMLYKFRTMFVDSPAYAVNPLSSLDPRITKVGRWLRRSSIDELPQFLNVLIGNMSVVGPRPEMPFIVDRYNEIHRERLLVKPGITGIWQISAVRGEAIHENIEYDLFYIDNQSILLDVIIVLKTILVAVRGVGAY
jgi:exopolysaccharide biosynthesis polyprenyl glycosylphosphotransferase